MNSCNNKEFIINFNTMNSCNNQEFNNKEFIINITLEEFKINFNIVKTHHITKFCKSIDICMGDVQLCRFQFMNGGRNTEYIKIKYMIR